MTETLVSLGFTPITDDLWHYNTPDGRRLSYLDGSCQLTDVDYNRWVTLPLSYTTPEQLTNLVTVLFGTPDIGVPSVNAPYVPVDSAACVLV